MIWFCKACNAAVLGRFAGDVMPAAASRSLSCAKFSESGTPTKLCTTLSNCCQFANWPERLINWLIATAPASSRRELSFVEPVKRKSISPHHIIARK